MLRPLARTIPVAFAWIFLTSCGLDWIDPFSEQAYEATDLAPVTPAEDLAPVTATGSGLPSDTEAIDLEALAAEGQSLVATATVPRVRVFRRPEGSKPVSAFRHPGPYDVPRVFLVERVRDDWLQVLLPVRPNGATGWIRAGDVDLAGNPYAIEVDVGDRVLTVSKRERVVDRIPVAVGQSGTPTPTGLFYTTILVRSDDPSGPYGPYAFGLSGYSEVLTEFAGGPGQIGIHGTNDPTALGDAVSFGCIRVDNATIRRLAGMLPLGTPVRVTN